MEQFLAYEGWAAKKIAYNNSPSTTLKDLYALLKPVCTAPELENFAVLSRHVLGDKEDVGLQGIQKILQHKQAELQGYQQEAWL